MKFTIDTDRKVITLLESCNFRQFIDEIKSIRQDIDDYIIDVMPAKVEHYTYMPVVPHIEPINPYLPRPWWVRDSMWSIKNILK